MEIRRVLQIRMKFRNLSGFCATLSSANALRLLILIALLRRKAVGKLFVSDSRRGRQCFTLRFSRWRYFPLEPECLRLLQPEEQQSAKFSKRKRRLEKSASFKLIRARKTICDASGGRSPAVPTPSGAAWPAPAYLPDPGSASA